MAEESNLEHFKAEFIKGYVDTGLDRLLDLRNAVQKSRNYDEIKVLMQAEQAFCKKFYGIPPVEVKHEAKERRSTSKNEDTADK